MEQSANQRDQNPQQIPGMQGLNQGGMVPPGMLPGNNPMDMLQMQQMQQMYQMQQMFGNMQPPKWYIIIKYMITYLFALKIIDNNNLI